MFASEKCVFKIYCTLYFITNNGRNLFYLHIFIIRILKFQSASGLKCLWQARDVTRTSRAGSYDAGSGSQISVRAWNSMALDWWLPKNGIYLSPQRSQQHEKNRKCRCDLWAVAEPNLIVIEATLSADYTDKIHGWIVELLPVKALLTWRRWSCTMD